MSATRKRTDAERLYLVVQHLARRLRDVEVVHDVSPARIAVLAHLRFHGVTNVGELAAKERVSRPAMTRLVQDMETAGLVRRGADQTDGRVVRVEITEAGQDLQERVRLGKIGIVESQLTALGAGDRAAIAQALEALTGVIELG